MKRQTHKDAELQEQISVLTERISNFHEGINEKLDRIEAQTIKTNGRVNTLETKTDKAEGALGLVKWIGVANVVAFIGYMVGINK